MTPTRLDAGEFRRVLAAEVVSNFGSMLSRVTIPWLATLVLDASALKMGMLLVADVGAAAVSTLLLGVAVDRWGKRAAMVATDLLRAAVLASVAAATLAGAARVRRRGPSWVPSAVAPSRRRPEHARRWHCPRRCSRSRPRSPGHVSWPCGHRPGGALFAGHAGA